MDSGIRETPEHKELFCQFCNLLRVILKYSACNLNPEMYFSPVPCKSEYSIDLLIINAKKGILVLEMAVLALNHHTLEIINPGAFIGPLS